MTGELAVVTTTNEVTPEWLAATLVAAGAAPAGARIEAMDQRRIGAGKLGHNIRYGIRWADGTSGGGEAGATEAPASVVGKFASDDPTSRQAGLVLGIYAREVGFYRDLAPRLPARIPRCHYQAMDPSSGDFLLLLEEIAPSTPGDQLAGCSADEAVAALAELALLHAACWGDPTLAELDWLGAAMFESPEGLQGFYQALLPGFAEKYAERLGPETMGVLERFADVVARWAAPTDETTTVLHGDYRLDNLLFGPPGHRVGIVDWQTVSIGPGIRDASYFLGAGLVVEDRRAHEMALLAEYHGALEAAGVRGVDFDECVTGYRRAGFGGIVMAVVASSVVGGDARGDEMFCVMAERHAAQVTDLDAFDLIG